MTDSNRHHIVIGDGGTAAAFAEMAQLNPGDRLSVIAHAPENLGRGLAYGDHAADAPWRYAYLLNSPSAAVLPEFADWLEDHWPEVSRAMQGRRPDWLGFGADHIAAGDLAALLLACANGTLADAEAARFSDETALTVVMAAEGYPGTPKKGGAIDLAWAEADDAKVFHAGTKSDGGALIANGGRVLNVTALGSNVTEAQAAAYKAVDAIIFPDGFCRRDIGWREVEREGND